MSGKNMKSCKQISHPNKTRAACQPLNYINIKPSQFPKPASSLSSTHRVLRNSSQFKNSLGSEYRIWCYSQSKCMQGNSNYYIQGVGCGQYYLCLLACKFWWEYCHQESHLNSFSIPLTPGPRNKTTTTKRCRGMKMNQPCTCLDCLTPSAWPPYWQPAFWCAGRDLVLSSVALPHFCPELLP